MFALNLPVSSWARLAVVNCKHAGHAPASADMSMHDLAGISIIRQDALTCFHCEDSMEMKR